MTEMTEMSEVSEVAEVVEAAEREEVADPEDDEPTHPYWSLLPPTVRVPKIAEIPSRDDPDLDDPTLEVVTPVDSESVTTIGSESVTVVERPIRGRPVYRPIRGSICRPLERPRPSDTLPDGIYYARKNRAA
jgi:hypothetical protein